MATTELVVKNALDEFGTLSQDGWTPKKTITPGQAIAAAKEALALESRDKFVLVDTFQAIMAFEPVEAIDARTGAALPALPNGDGEPWMPVDAPEIESPVDLSAVPEDALAVREFNAIQLVHLQGYSPDYILAMLRTAERFPPNRRGSYYKKHGPHSLHFSHFKELSAADLPEEFVTATLIDRAKEGISLQEIVRRRQSWRAANKMNEDEAAGIVDVSGTGVTVAEAEERWGRDVYDGLRAAGLEQEAAQSAGSATVAWLWTAAPTDLLKAALKARRA